MLKVLVLKIVLNYFESRMEDPIPIKWDTMFVFIYGKRKGKRRNEEMLIQ